MTKDDVAMDNSTEPFNALAVSMNGNKRPEGDPMPVPHYTMPGILHFLQTEWARYEMDRAQWEVDRAELQVTIVSMFELGDRDRLNVGVNIRIKLRIRVKIGVRVRIFASTSAFYR